MLGAGLALAVVPHLVSHPRPASSLSRSTTRPPPGAAVGCGPIALLAVMEAIDPQAGRELQRRLRSNTQASPLTTLQDLAEWARQSGIDPIGLRVPVALLTELPTPFIAHLRPSHFTAVIAVQDDGVLIRDGDARSRWLSRQDFSHRFTGHVLCLQRGSPAPARGARVQ